MWRTANDSSSALHMLFCSALQTTWSRADRECAYCSHVYCCACASMSLMMQSYSYSEVFNFLRGFTLHLIMFSMVSSVHATKPQSQSQKNIKFLLCSLFSHDKINLKIGQVVNAFLDSLHVQDFPLLCCF
jgi:hypothetical protein